MKLYSRLFTTLAASMTLFGCALSPTSSPVQSGDVSSSVDPRPGLRKNYVRASGKELVGEDEKNILLRGTNVGGMFIPERWMCLTDCADLLQTINILTERFSRKEAFELLDIYQQNFWTEEDWSNVTELGINCLRLPISYADVYDTEFDLLRFDEIDPEELPLIRKKIREDHLSKIDAFIDEAERHGIYIVLDLHGAFGSQNGNDHSIDSRGHDWLWYPDALGEEFRKMNVELWQYLATRYRGFRNIAGYDLLNEPAGDSSDKGCVTSLTTKTQWDYFDVLYKAIREIDPNHLLIMESCWTANDLPNPKTYGWENIMYEFHHYEGGGVGEDDYQITSYANRVKNIVGADFGIPLYMGEFCPHASYEAWEKILANFNQNHINWTTWTYRVKYVNNEWGLYGISTSNEDLPRSEIPAILRGNDSYSEIARKWGEAQRNGNRKNEGLCEVVSAAAKAAIDFSK